MIPKPTEKRLIAARALVRLEKQGTYLHIIEIRFIMDSYVFVLEVSALSQPLPAF